MSDIDYYGLLGIEPTANADAIRQAYRRQINRHHPDKPGGDGEQARLLEEARAVLLDPAARARYDAGRFTGDVVGEAVEALADVGDRAIDQLTLTLNARGHELVGALGRRLLDSLRRGRR